jgi:hypothetical protein
MVVENDSTAIVQARAAEHAAEHKLEGCEIFGGYQELLDNADVDAIYVPSPNGLHFDWTMKSLEAGFHGVYPSMQMVDGGSRVSGGRPPPPPPCR